ncbi:RHS repeat domain-containing protein [Dyella monticola]|nr:RHS repeat-associated core domain-containing protein [Dyella monticola]
MSANASGPQMKGIKTVLRWMASLMLFVSMHALAQGLGTVTYVYTDPQGTPLAETDAHGNITATFEYTPYGTYAPTGTTNPGPDPTGPSYTGHVNDPESNLVYMQARYYDSVTGRFLSVDPVTPGVGNEFSFNRYDYGDNNPIANIDPNGKFPGDPGGDAGDSAYNAQLSGSVSGTGNLAVTKANNNAPNGTPKSMKKYFCRNCSRAIAAMQTMSFFNIDYSGLTVFYNPAIQDNADTLQQAQLIVGPNLFSNRSFGGIGLILSHEVEGHWDLQLKGAYTVDYRDQPSWMREVQAYRYELKPSNIARFLPYGLTQGEIDQERSNLMRYYNGLTPTNKKNVDSGIYKPW